MKTEKARRRITFEALDSGTPDVANVGNPGDVWLASLLRGETPRHGWLIHDRRALSVFIIFSFLILINIALAFIPGFFLLTRIRRWCRCDRSRHRRRQILPPVGAGHE